MNDIEIAAIAVADKHRGDVSIADKIEWLKKEVKELEAAILNNDLENINEEIGDVAYLLLHIASIVYSKDKSVLDYIEDAKNKMIHRAVHGKK